MIFTGRIWKVQPVQTGTRKDGTEWRKQDFVFEYYEHDTDRYTDKVLLSVMGDRIEEYALKVGDKVTIGFSHGVREWQDRMFNEVRIYQFRKEDGALPTVAGRDAVSAGMSDDEPF